MEKPRNARRTWSEEEDSSLKTLWKNKVSVQEIAKILNRTIGGVGYRIYHLGLYETEPSPSITPEVEETGPHTRRAWKPSDDANLAKWVKEGWSPEIIASWTDRTVRAITHRMSVHIAMQEKDEYMRQSSPAPLPTAPDVEVELGDAPRWLQDEDGSDFRIGTISQFPNDSAELSLFLWFMRQAWLEGCTVILPALNIVFNGDKEGAE